MPVEHGDGHGVADRDEVPDVDEGVDAGDVAALGEPPEQRLGGVAVLGRLGAEPGEGAAPRGDLGHVRNRGRLQPPGGGPLFGPVLFEQPCGLGPFASPVAWMTPARISGYRPTTASW